MNFLPCFNMDCMADSFTIELSAMNLDILLFNVSKTLILWLKTSAFLDVFISTSSSGS